MEKRYAVAYINDGDKQTTFNGYAICLFGQTKWEVDRVKQYLIAFLPEKETAGGTYNALAKAIGKKVGEEVEIVFTQGNATIWKPVEKVKTLNDLNNIISKHTGL